MWPLLCLFYVCVYLSKCLGGVVHTRPHSLSWYEGFFFFTNGIPEVVCGLCTPLVYVFGVTHTDVLYIRYMGPNTLSGWQITSPVFACVFCFYGAPQWDMCSRGGCVAVKCVRAVHVVVGCLRSLCIGLWSQ